MFYKVRYYSQDIDMLFRKDKTSFNKNYIIVCLHYIRYSSFAQKNSCLHLDCLHTPFSALKMQILCVLKTQTIFLYIVVYVVIGHKFVSNNT